MVDFTLNAKLVTPCDSRSAVANELRKDVGWLGHPAVKGVFFDAVGACIAGGVRVDDAGGVNGDHTVVRISKEALGHLNFVGVDAFKNAFNDQGDVVSQDGNKGLVGAVNPVAFSGFCRHVTPRNRGRPRAVRV